LLQPLIGFLGLGAAVDLDNTEHLFDHR
jgi:hypothetical protein